MAGSAYEYTIALVDKISAPARAASGALGALKTQLSAVESVKRATAPAAAATSPAARAAAPAAAAPAAPALPAVKLPPIDTRPPRELGDAFKGAADAIKTGEAIIGGAITGIRSAVTSLASGDVVGAIGGVTDAVSSLAKSLDLIAPGLGQVASAVISVAGGIAGALTGSIVGLTKFAIASTEAKNASLAQWDALGAGLITGAEVDDMLDSLRASTGLTKDALGPLTTAFMRMGITGKEALEGLTVAAASAEAVVKGGGEAFAALFQKVDAAAQTGSKLTMPFGKLQKSLIAAGLNVSDLAKAMGKTEAEITAGLKAGTIDAQKFGDAMTEAITKKGAGPMATLANSAANLGKLLQEYLGDLFEDLGKDVAPFMSAVREAFSVLDTKSSPLGAQLKSTIGDAMHRILATLTSLVPVAREAFWTLVVWALKAYIAVAPIVFRIRDMITSATGMKVLGTVGGMVLTAFKAIGVVLAVVVGFVAAFMAVSVAAGVIVWNLIASVVKAGAAAVSFVGGVLAAIAGVIGSIVGWFVGVGARILGALSPVFTVVADLFGQVAAIIMTLLAPVGDFLASVWAVIVGAFTSAGAAIMGALTSVWDSIASIFSPAKALEIANGLVDGLVNGIGAGAQRVADALKNVGQGAIDGVKGILGIHSPSAVMAELGGHTAEGFAQGVDGGADRTQGALAAVVAPPPAAAAGGASGGGGGAAFTINVGGITLTVGAGASKETAAQIAEVLPAAIARAFEEVALQLGGATGGGEPA